MRQLTLLQSAIYSYYKLRQLFYYKVWQGLLQIATGITKCYDYYKLRQYTYPIILTMIQFFLQLLSRVGHWHIQGQFQWLATLCCLDNLLFLVKKSENCFWASLLITFDKIGNNEIGLLLAGTASGSSSFVIGTLFANFHASGNGHGKPRLG